MTQVCHINLVWTLKKTYIRQIKTSLNLTIVKLL